MDVRPDDDDHAHCLRCVSRHCQPAGLSPSEQAASSAAAERLGSGGGCAQLDCALGCGARYHACKAAEHALLCSLASAPCANREYGCSAVVRRCHLARHLAVCPASAVVCTMEWNRQMLCSDQWPAWPQQQQPPSAATAATTAVAADGGHSQLDASWLARDKRRLLSSLELAGSSLAHSLRSPLTPGWPAVPFVQEPSFVAVPAAAAGVDEAGEAAASSRSSADALLAASRVSVAAAAALMAAGAVEENSSCRKPAAKASVSGSSPDRRTPAYHVQCSLCAARARGGPTAGSGTEHSCLSSGIPEAVDLKPGTDVVGSKGTVGEDSSTSEWPTTSLDGDSNSGGTSRTRAPPQQQQPPLRPAIPTEGSSTEVAAEFGESIRLDLIMETYNSFRVKPVSMYTFRCAESFRRSEYSSHYRNVHADIQAGLNGWFEWRCPLAAYGCPWSVHRFATSPSNDRVVFSPIVDGFGVTSDCVPPPCAADCASGDLPRSAAPDPVHAADGGPELADTAAGSQLHPVAAAGEESARSAPPDRLTGLPEELLSNILLYVDSFSLNSVALTCKVLRNACCRLLDRRGIVSSLWEKVAIANEQPTWQCSSHVWTFSKHFAPVKQWRFVSDTALINHLQTCQFNKKHRFQHPDLAKHRMLPFESEPTEKKEMGLRKQSTANRLDFF